MEQSKTDLKKQIRELRGQIAEALTSKDSKRAKKLRLKTKRLKRATRKQVSSTSKDAPAAAAESQA